MNKVKRGGEKIGNINGKRKEKEDKREKVKEKEKTSKKKSPAGKTHIKKSGFFSGRTTKRGEGGNPPDH